MSKIVGITVGTPMSPRTIKDKLQPVTSVNGVNADEHGNVEIEVSSGGGSGSGVPSDWSVNDRSQSGYIENRTHYRERLFDTITWDGNTEGRDSIDVSVAMGMEPGEFIVYKVSDQVLNSDMLRQATVTNTIGYEQPGIATVSGKLEIMPDYEPYGIYCGGCSFGWYPPPNNTYEDHSRVTIVSTSLVGDFTDTLGAVIPSPGTYCIHNGKFFMELSGDVYRQLDGRYLQDGMPYELPPVYEYSWDGNMEGHHTIDLSLLGYDAGTYFVKVSDDVVDPIQSIGGEYQAASFDGRTYNHTIYDDSIDDTTYPGMTTIDNMVAIVYSAEELASAMGVPEGFFENGVYLLRWEEPDVGAAYISRFAAPPRIIKMYSKFLPADVAKFETVQNMISEAIGNAIRGSY